MLTKLVMRALIKHSLDAPTRARRLAAGMLVEFFRSGRASDAVDALTKLSDVASDKGREVADEMKNMIADYGLGRPRDPKG
jgi:hypothetical protein